MKRDKIVLLLLIVIASQLPSYAYLDPGTGSFIIQILIATFAGVAYWVKLQWNNIKGFLSNLCAKKK